MSTIERGYVTALSPAVARCRVQIFGGPQVSALYLESVMPPPRAIVWVEQLSSGAWIIRGSECDVRQVITEDFGYYNNTGLVTGLDRFDADQTWALDHVGASALTPGVTAGTGQTYQYGMVNLVTGGVIGDYITLRKEATILSPHSGILWMSAVVAVDSTTNVLVRLGFGDTTYYDFGAAGGGSRFVGFQFETGSSGNWLTTAALGVPATTIDTGAVVVADKYVRLDILHQPGVFAAGFVDGQPLANIATTIPAAGANMVAHAGIYPHAAAARTLRLDWIRMAVIASGIQAP
jgi:hypothetical protein